jgi:hypothetical protein
VSRRFTVGPDGWRTDIFSFLGEVNLEFSPKIGLLLSGRTDKNSYSNFLFSPRTALISDRDDAGVFKLIAQRSFRINAACKGCFRLKFAVKGSDAMTACGYLTGLSYRWNLFRA